MKYMENDSKRFPADTTLIVPRFLNMKQIDGELYGFLTSLTEKDGDYILRKNMPTQSFICKVLKCKSPKTYRKHLQDLIEHGFVEAGQGEVAYRLPQVEDFYMYIPLETVQYLTDNCKEHVFKIYIYLGQKFRQKKEYEFTLKELGEHVGLKVENSSRGYEILNNALKLLENSGLIVTEEFYDGVKPKRRILDFYLRMNHLFG